MLRELISGIKAGIKRMLGKDIMRVAGESEAAVSEMMSKKLRLWGEMYQNNAPWLSDNVKSLNLPATIASEFARMVTLEVETAVTGDNQRVEFLQTQYQKVLKELRRQVEYGCSKGGLVFKPYLDSEGGIGVDFVQNDCFYPIAFDSSGHITGAVFVARVQHGQTWYTKLERQKMEKGRLLITNQAFKSQTQNDLGTLVALAAVAEWAEITPEAAISNVTRPLFSYFKVPHANTIDAASPLGVSVYARAVQQIADADKQYSRILWEYEAGEMALDADETLFRRDCRGNLQLPQGRERLFRVLTGIDDDGKKLNAWAPTLRDESLFRGLNELLKRVEDLCGLARGVFSAPDNEARTATELKLLKQRSYATVTDMQSALEDALRELVDSMDVLATTYSLEAAGQPGSYEVTFAWDDSIVTDSEAQRKIDLQEMVEGVMDKYEYRMKWYGEDEATAKKKMAVIEQREGEEDEQLDFGVGV